MERPRLSRWIVRSWCVAALLVTAVGSWLMLRQDNMADFNDLRQFTSASHQDDRCDTQAAFDAQVKIREHFESTGGLTDEQAESMAPIVGLTPAEMKNLVAVELFPMNYDCEVPVASSQEVTIGMVLVAGGASAALTLLVVEAVRRVRSSHSNASSA